MEDIEIKSTGELIDSLITTSLKCWFAQEDLHRLYKANKKSEAAEAAIKAQQMNARRNKLIRAINSRLLEPEDSSPTEKTYG